MMYKYWFVIWGVCSSCLTVLSRYIDLLFGELFFTFITCNDVSWLPYACFGCVITFRNFNFVRVLSQTRATCALSEKKRERRSYSSHKSQNHYTTFFIDSVAFAKETRTKRMKPSKIEVWLLQDCVTSNWYRKGNQNNIWSISGVVILQSKETKTANKQTNS